jgi:bifunctional DNA-binding transcriptional regulator/antitoxin component of YhaV-PrlF toxin-antitoxin module
MVLEVTQEISQGKAIELPDEILEHLGVRPGDKVNVAVSGPGRIEIRRAIEPLTLTEFLERFRIDRAVDMKALREEIEEDMARDALRSLER